MTRVCGFQKRKCILVGGRGQTRKRFRCVVVGQRERLSCFPGQRKIDNVEFMLNCLQPHAIAIGGLQSRGRNWSNFDFRQPYELGFIFTPSSSVTDFVLQLQMYLLYSI